MNLLCENPTNARLNRERVEGGYCNEYYDSQTKKMKGWQWGKRPPKELRIGELPYLDLGKLRLDPLEER